MRKSPANGRWRTEVPRAVKAFRRRVLAAGGAVARAGCCCRGVAVRCRFGEILAVRAEVLSDQVYFPHAARNEAGNFGDNSFYRTAPERAPDKRNGAKGTAVIAAFGNLDVRRTRKR